MAKEVQQFGATTSQLASYKGKNKQIVVNRDNHRIHVMDGSTNGGVPHALKSEVDAAQAKADAALPKSGGAMSGGITFTGSDGFFKKNAVGGRMVIYGGTTNNDGSSLYLYGKDHGTYPSWFALVAHNGTTSTSLQGKPNGDLLWGGNNVITSAGGEMVGAITHTKGTMLKTVGGTNAYYIMGGDSLSKCSFIELTPDTLNTGESWRTPSMMRLCCRDSVNGISSDLVMHANSSLTWAGKEIERVNSSGDGWIRYESGLQICWGSYQVTSGTQVSEVIFPVPFLSKSSYVPNANSLTKGNINLICVRDANSANGEKMSVQAYLQGNTSAPTTAYYVAWSARGKWK